MRLGHGFKKGFFFTFDALIAVAIIVGALTVMYSFYVESDDNYNSNYVGQDVLSYLSNLKIRDVQHYPYVQELIANGNITRLDISFLEQIGEFWALNKTDMAHSLIGNITYGKLPDELNFGFYINGDELFETTAFDNESGFIIPVKKMVSGYERERPISGTTSQAYLQSILNKVDSSFAYFGGFIGQGNITFNVKDVSADAIFVEMILEIDSASDFKFYVNENQCGTIYADIPSVNITVEEYDLTSCMGDLVAGGQNNFTVNFMNGTNDAYYSGGILTIRYNTSEKNTALVNSKNFSLFGITGIINNYDSFYVPGVLNNMYVHLHYFANHTNESNNTFYMTIGNVTVFTDDNSTTQQWVTLSNVNLDSVLNYSLFSQNTVPYRLGFENLSYVSEYIGNADVGLITDVSGSMGWTMISGTVVRRNCDDVNLGDGTTQRLSVAKCIDKTFAADILNTSGNKISLVSYHTSTVAGDVVTPTTNFSLINNTVGTSSPQTGYTPLSSTCICCGINSQKDVLINNIISTTLIANASSGWFYDDTSLYSFPVNDTSNREWFEKDFDDIFWPSGSGVLGATNGYVYNPLVDTELNTGGGSVFANIDLWEHTGDLPGAPNDFTSNILNDSGVNTFGLVGADDGWDYAPAGTDVFGYDDNGLIYPGVVDGKLTFNISSSNSCANDDCSGGYGVEFIVNATLQAYIAAGGKAVISFDYEWQGNFAGPFESSDEVWIKGYIDTPSFGIKYLGSEQSNDGDDSTLEIAFADDPDTFISGQHNQDISAWLDVVGNYYLVLGGKLNASENQEYGSFSFDNVKIELVADDPNIIEVDLFEHNNDLAGPPVDFTSGFLNSTANSYRLPANNAEYNDGWDWDVENNAGPFGYDDNIDYNFIQSGRLEFDNADDSSGSDNSCSDRDCSGAYGISLNITQQMIDILNTGGSAYFSFDYWWETSHQFEDSDEVWFKAKLTKPSTNSVYLGEDKDSSHNGGDADLDIDAIDNPDFDYNDKFFDDIGNNFDEGAGIYYLEIGGKIYANNANEYGWWIFDNIRLQITNKTQKYYFRKHFNIADASIARKGVLNLLSDDRAKVYLNGNLILSETNSDDAKYWNVRGRTIPEHYFVTGDNVIAVYLENNARSAKFNLELLGLNDSRDKAMMVMTDGEANVRCNTEQGTGNSKEDAVLAACMAKQDWGITVYAVGFSSAADEYTLSRIADCGEGTYFRSDNVTQLEEFYRDVSSQIVYASRQSQSLTVSSSGGQVHSTLYDDSYIQINYTPIVSAPGFDEIEVMEVVKGFNNCTLNFNVPSQVKVTEALVTSYSGDHWTDLVKINDTVVFNLSEYGEIYATLGDPFVINIPSNLMTAGSHNITIKTGDDASNNTGCSDNNTLIYTGLIKASTSYVPVLPKSEGCTWTIEYDSGGSVVMGVPDSYTGPGVCTFTSAGVSYDANDSIDVAIYSMLRQLDYDGDNQSNVNFADSDLEINIVSVPRVPYMWGPALIEIRGWY